MIFRAESAQKIVRGEKTQTRRRVNGVCRYRVGQDYSVQPGRAKREIARILVTGIRRERLGEIGHRDARDEGFPSVDEFWDAWSDIHGRFSRDELVDVIDFVLCARRDPGAGAEVTQADLDRGEELAERHGWD